MRYILSLYILSSFFLFGQNGITVGDIDFSYSQPKEYELGPIRVIGADNFEHQAIKLDQRQYNIEARVQLLIVRILGQRVARLGLVIQLAFSGHLELHLEWIS